MLSRSPVHYRAAMVALAVACSVTVVSPAAAQSISATTAYQRAKTGRLMLVDVRTPSEWAATGSPRHARRLTATQPRKIFLARLGTMTRGNRTTPIALICASGVRSAEMRETLELAGYRRVVDVSEGMHGSAAGPGWIASGLPVDRVMSVAAD